MKIIDTVYVNGVYVPLDSRSVMVEGRKKVKNKQVKVLSYSRKIEKPIDEFFYGMELSMSVFNRLKRMIGG